LCKLNGKVAKSVLIQVQIAADAELGSPESWQDKLIFFSVLHF
jgi:hypothetical protein